MAENTEIQGIVDSTKDVIQSRINNPILGTFILSWLVFNWKGLLFVFLDDRDIQRKIEILQSDYSNIYSNLVFPLSSTIFLVFTTSFLQIFIKLYQGWINSRIRENELEQLKKLEAKEKEFVEYKKGHNLLNDYTKNTEISKKIFDIFSDKYIDFDELHNFITKTYDDMFMNSFKYSIQEFALSTLSPSMDNTEYAIKQKQIIDALDLYLKGNVRLISDHKRKKSLLHKELYSWSETNLQNNIITLIEKEIKKSNEKKFIIPKGEGALPVYMILLIILSTFIAFLMTSTGSN